MSPRFKPEASALVLIDYHVGTMRHIKKLMLGHALRAVITFNMPTTLPPAKRIVSKDRSPPACST
jgi:hypothetical protein